MPSRIAREMLWNVPKPLHDAIRNAMTYTLKQAAEATGKSKSTIFRAIKAHTISGIRDENGEWQIDPAELHRVFPPVSDTAPRHDAMRNDEIPNEIVRLRREVEIKDEQLAAERRERDRERDTLRETMTDLREDRDRWRAQAEHATRLLTDQREKAQEPPPAPPRRSWWSWRKG